jgi:hypothetical protein
MRPVPPIRSLTAAVTRLAAHKRLVTPMSLGVHESRQRLTVWWRWDNPALRPPRLLALFELVFLVQLARVEAALRHQGLRHLPLCRRRRVVVVDGTGGWHMEVELQRRAKALDAATWQRLGSTSMTPVCLGLHRRP